MNLGRIISLLPFLFSLILFIFVIINYFFSKNKLINKIKIDNKKIFYTYLLFLVIYFLSLTIFQYYVWRKEDIGRFLLPPYQSIDYFIKYSFFHFWLGFIFDLLTVIFFSIFLRALDRNKNNLSNDDFFLALFCSLFIGWPNFLIYLPSVFIVLLILSAINHFILKQNKNFFVLASLIAALLTIFFGTSIIVWLGIGNFNI